MFYIHMSMLYVKEKKDAITNYFVSCLPSIDSKQLEVVHKHDKTI